MPIDFSSCFATLHLTSLRQTVKTQRRYDDFTHMPDLWNSKSQPKVERVKLTARVSLEAYDLISELQRKHRGETGRAFPYGRSSMRQLELMQETTQAGS